MERQIHINGTDIYSYLNNNMHSFCLGIYIKAGSMYENDKNNGIAHLYEHMVFRNIKKFYGDGFYTLLSKNGLYFNASTYREFIQFEFVGIKESFPFLLDIISKLFLDFNLSSDEIKEEKNRIKAEIRENDERRTIAYYYDNLVWSGTSLDKTITGYCKTIDKISQKALNEYKKSIISQGNLFFYVTGNVNETQMKELKECVAKLPISKHNIGYTNTAPVPQNFFNRKPDVAVYNSYWTYVKIGFDIDNKRISSPIRDLIYSVLFESDDALFNQGLSEKNPMIYSYDSTLEQYRNISNIKVQFEIDRKNLYNSLEKTVEVINNLKNGLFDYDAVLMKKISAHKFCLDNVVNLNWDLAYEGHIIENGVGSEIEYEQKYMSVTKQQIVDCANEIFKTENLSIAVKGRKKEIDVEEIRTILNKLD